MTVMDAFSLKGKVAIVTGARGCTADRSSVRSPKPAR